jgi:DNA-directed RNA polymerase subunit RPC12/RpoP
MRLLAKCPACGGQIPFSIRDLDKRKFCERCGRQFKIPNAEQIRTALATAQAVGESVYVDEQGRIYG